MSDSNESGAPATQTPEEELTQMRLILEATQAKLATSEATIEKHEARVMSIPNGGDIQVDEGTMDKLKSDANKKDVKMVTITISGAVGEKDRPVFVGYQGVGWSIQRGKPARVPVPVVHILQNAIKSHYDCDEEGNITESLVPLYPFTIAM